MASTAGSSGPSAGGGSRVEAHIPVLLTAAKSMQAAAAQMLSAAIPTVVPPAGLDEVSLKAAARLNTRAINLVKSIDSGSWALAGGATEVENAAYSFMAKEAENAGSFSGTGVAGGVPTAQMPAFPPPPSVPDVVLPDIPAPPGVVDAEYTSMLVNGGSGEAPHVAAAEFWNTTGQSLTQISDVLGVAREALRTGWQSPDAENVHAALQKFNAWVDDTGKSSTQLGQDWDSHINGWRRVRNNIASPEEASTTKNNLVQAMNDNAANGGMSTGEVVRWTNEYSTQNTTAQTEMASYNADETSAPPFAEPGAPPPISSSGPPRVEGTPRPAPGTLKDRLTDDPALKGLQDPKAIMAAMMAAAAGAAGGLGAISQAGKGLFQPIQQIPQQLAQLSQMAQTAGAANAAKSAASVPRKASPSAAKNAGGGAGGGKGGGGTKPAGLGGGAKLSTPPPAAVPATPAAPAVRGVAPAAGVGGPSPAGMGMMRPMGAMAGAAGRGDQKDKTRNKELFPDEPFDEDNQEYAPAVLGAKPDPTAPKPTYDRKLGSAPLKKAG
ncbi:PPE domain-containing protein [Mycobacterium hubeiense]|uniref:PPE domain-containing protein n=1 Tax=Mycobacterium hubeiense TaxID=1867256 RepID=UPI00115BC0A5|nr:PPE domain-containing protein [Mycobacterium sp. QGD 101]